MDTIILLAIATEYYRILQEALKTALYRALSQELYVSFVIGLVVHQLFKCL